MCNDLRAILADIERNRLYDLNKEVRSRNEFEDFIRSHPQSRSNPATSQKLMGFLKTYLKTEQEAKELASIVERKLIPEVEALQLKLQQTDENFRALQLIEQNHDFFTDMEREELFALFGMYGNSTDQLDQDTLGRRQQYWNLELNLSKNKDRRIVAQYAISAYGSL